LDQAPAQLTGQTCVLQFSVADPTQFAPPLEGAGELHARVRVPPAQGAEQSPKAPQAPATGTAQACVLHALALLPPSRPLQSAPVPPGDGLVHVRFLLPPPQSFEHAPQSLHPPSTPDAVEVQKSPAVDPVHASFIPELFGHS